MSQKWPISVTALLAADVADAAIKAMITLRFPCDFPQMVLDSGSNPGRDPNPAVDKPCRRSILNGEKKSATCKCYHLCAQQHAIVIYENCTICA
eukprot:3015645-Pleurochrysis_carterae.AAC.2